MKSPIDLVKSSKLKVKSSSFAYLGAIFEQVFIFGAKVIVGLFPSDKNEKMSKRVSNYLKKFFILSKMFWFSTDSASLK